MSFQHRGDNSKVESGELETMPKFVFRKMTGGTQLLRWHLGRGWRREGGAPSRKTTYNNDQIHKQ